MIWPIKFQSARCRRSHSCTLSCRARARSRSSQLRREARPRQCETRIGKVQADSASSLLRILRKVRSLLSFLTTIGTKVDIETDTLARAAKDRTRTLMAAKATTRAHATARISSSIERPKTIYLPPRETGRARRDQTQNKPKGTTRLLLSAVQERPHQVEETMDMFPAMRQTLSSN